MGKLICPRCGSFTAPMTAKFPAYMRISGSSGSYRHERGEADAETVAGNPTLAFMICQDCENLFVAEKDLSSNWHGVYPLQHKKVAEEIPDPIKGEFEEANICFAVGAYKACLAVSEIALESMWKEKKVSGLKDLKDSGVISEKLFKKADQIRRWANITKHELMDEIVTAEEAEQLLLYLEQIFSEVYVEDQQLSKMEKRLVEIKNKAKAELKSENRHNPPNP